MLDTLKNLVDNVYFYSLCSDDFAEATRTLKCPRCLGRIRWMRLRLMDRNGKPPEARRARDGSPGGET